MPNYEKAARKAAVKYGVDPDIYVAQLRQESGLRMGLRSPAGAQDIAQFMPGTAKSYGVTLGDGRAADDLDGGARYMRDNLKQFGGDYSKALAAYNAGAGAVQKYGGVPPYRETQNYVSTILANAGKGSAPKLKKTAAPSAAPSQPTQTTTTTPGVDNSGLRRQLVGQFLQQGGVANPNAVLTLAGSYGQAADVPGTTTTAPSPSTTASPSSPRLTKQTKAYPLAEHGKVIGTPYAGTHSLGNWQSDNAVDIAVPEGTPMVALQDGVVLKVTKHPQGAGRFAGDQVTVKGKNGNEYFYAHGVANVKAGQKIKRGQSLGTTGSANGVAHLHYGQMRGDPRQHAK